MLCIYHVATVLSSSLLYIDTCFHYHFLYARRTSFNISCSVGCRWYILWTFMSGKVCMSPLFLKGSFIENKIDIFFSFSTFKMLLHSSCTNSDKKLAVILTFYVTYLFIFFLAAFKIFLFILGAQLCTGHFG